MLMPSSGFLGQMVVAMEVRLVPIATWFWSYARSGYRVEPPSPHGMRDRSLQAWFSPRGRSPFPHVALRALA
jgi:hypothetical protein